MDGKEPNFQMSFAFVDRQIEKNIIQQRLMDGYVNATALCEAAGEKINDYYRLKSTTEYMDALYPEMGIPVSGLNQIVRKGVPELQGTWMYPFRILSQIINK